MDVGDWWLSFSPVGAYKLSRIFKTKILKKWSDWNWDADMGDLGLFHWNQSDWCPYSLPFFTLIKYCPYSSSSSLAFIKQFFITSIFSFDFCNQTVRYTLQKCSIIQMRKLKLQELMYVTNMVTLQVQLRHFNFEFHTFSLFPVVCNPSLSTCYLFSKPDIKVLCLLTDLIFWTSRGDTEPQIHYVIVKKSLHIFEPHFSPM